jgi:hypothetical protein
METQNKNNQEQINDLNFKATVVLLQGVVAIASAVFALYVLITL